MGHALSSSQELDRMGIAALLVTRRSGDTTIPLLRLTQIPLQVRQLPQLHPISLLIHLPLLTQTISTVTLPRPPPWHLLQWSTILSRPSSDDTLATLECSSVHKLSWKQCLGPLLQRERHSLDSVRTQWLLPRYGTYSRRHKGTILTVISRVKMSAIEVYLVHHLKRSQSKLAHSWCSLTDFLRQ